MKGKSTGRFEIRRLEVYLREFRREDDKFAKVVELKQLEQGSQTMDKFI